MKTSTPNKIEGVLQKPIMTSVYSKYVHCEGSRIQGPLSRYNMAVTQEKNRYGVRRLGHGSRGGKNYLAVGHEGCAEMRTRREHKRTAGEVLLELWRRQGGQLGTEHPFCLDA